jgi:hypothetical protein
MSKVCRNPTTLTIPGTYHNYKMTAMYSLYSWQQIHSKNVTKKRLLEEDNNYLKSSLWPLLEGFFASANIVQFRSYYFQSFLETDTKMPKVFELLGQLGISNFLEGEGTGQPHGSTSLVSPHRLVQYVTNFEPFFMQRNQEKKESRAKTTQGGRGRVRTVLPTR